jgi:hypothetical protein
LRVCSESAVTNHLFAFFDFVFQAASKRHDVVKLASGEWAIDKDDVRAEDGKGDQVPLLDCSAIILLLRKYRLSCCATSATMAWQEAPP